MVGKQLKAAKYKDLQTYLSQNAHHKPLCPIHELDIILNGERYTLFIQLDRHSKVCALYAHVNQACPKLITENLILSALLELVIFQCIP